MVIEVEEKEKKKFGASVNETSKDVYKLQVTVSMKLDDITMCIVSIIRHSEPWVVERKFDL